jgi:hypothetical protein
VTLTSSDGLSGTLAFATLASGFYYSNVLISLQDGSQTPQWAVINLGDSLASGGITLSWDWLTLQNCGTGQNPTSCWGSPSSALSGISIWYTITQNAVTTPLPGALPLFAAGIGLIGFAARRKRRTARLSA